MISAPHAIFANAAGAAAEAVVSYLLDKRSRVLRPRNLVRAAILVLLPLLRRSPLAKIANTASHH